MRAYVGVDWSATEIVCAVATEEGAVRRGRYRSRPSLPEVRSLLEDVVSETGAIEVWSMVEAGAPQWVELLHAAGAKVFVVDPKQARRFAESLCSSGAKDDPRDAGSLAEQCRSRARHLEAWSPDGSELRQLDVLAAVREQRAADGQRARQRLRSVLCRTMPLVEARLPSGLDSVWVTRFLRAVPTPWHAGSLTRDGFDELLRGAHAATRDGLWTALQETLASVVPERAVADAFALQVHQELDLLSLLDRQASAAETRVDEVTRELPSRQAAESMPGIGSKLSLALLRFGFRDELPASRDAVSVKLGASPVFVGSGRDPRTGRPKGGARMRRSSSPQARRTTYLVGRLATQHHAWARAMFADGRSRGQTAATAYRRVCRSVLRILSSLVRTGDSYDESRYVASLKARGVPWAMSL
jgi:transposase